MVDGSLIFDTKIDTDGVEKGTDNMSSKFVDLKNKIANTEAEISKLTQELKEMADTPIKTDVSKKLEKDVEKSKAKLKELYAEADRIGNTKQADLTDMGLDLEYLDAMLARDKNWQKIQSQIDVAETKLAEYQKQLENVRNTENKATGKDTAEYKEKQLKIDQLNRKLNVYQVKLRETREREENTGNQVSYSTDKYKKAAKALKEFNANLKKVAKKNVVSVFKKTGTALKNIFIHTKKANKQMGLFGRLLRQVKQAMAGLLIYQVLQGALQSMKEGLDNLAKASPKVNKNLSLLVSSLSYLKHSLATAFAPILNIVTPILTGFMDTISSVTNKVANFIATLTGQSSYMKAIKVQKDYVESLDESTKATEKLDDATQKNLASFDELNVMQQNSDIGDNTGDESNSDSVFKTIPVKISGLGEKLKNAFTQGDYSGIGEILGNKVNSAVQRLNEFISWENVGAKITNGIKSLATAFNSFIDTVDWFLIGDTIAQGFNTALNSLYLIITEFDWVGLSASLAESFNGFVSGVDWALLGQTITESIKTALDMVTSFVTTFDWVALGQGIATSINNIDWVSLLSSLGSSIGSVIEGLLDLVIGFAEQLDWEKLGSDLQNGIIGFIKKIDWGGIISKAFRLLGVALGGAVSLIVGVCKSLWESLKSGFEATKDYFNRYIDEAGGNIIVGIWNGIIEAMKNVGTWIKEKIWDPFVKGFNKTCDLKGIFKDAWNNALTVFNNTGKFFSNVWETIKNAFKNVSDWFGGVFTNAWTAVKNVFSKGGQIFLGIKDGILNGLKTVINGLITGINKVIEVPFNGLNFALRAIKGVEIAGFKPFDWINEITVPQIPKLATGTVVPASYGEFLAILGDNKRETEVVSPLSTIKQALVEAMSEIGGFSGNEEINLNVYLDGDKIFKSVVNRNNRYKKSHGKSAM